ncbi:MAG: hydroxymethylglutaryl-CoA reductase (NADPH) [Thermoprotei archaeon]|nr:MAG: hydroxymethylglutaryl-CoA reductase (NADPH) [Thermoprotei archaeon]
MKRHDIVDEFVQEIIDGRVKLHEVERLVNGDSNLATVIRRRFLEKVLGVELKNIGTYSIDFNEVVGRNCENTIGVTQVPLGIVGPLRVLGDYARGDFYVPLATTEGALVASVNRGCKAITLSGGARVKVLRDSMARAPVFELPSVEDVPKFIEWVRSHFNELKKVAESTTRYGKLIEITPFVAGKFVWLRFSFTTGDAMGMNMVTIATDRAVKYIEEEFPGARCISLSGNMCVDKKPTSLNVVLGRGKTVTAEATIRRDVVEKVLKTSPEAIAKVNTVKNLLGSAYAGSLSFNAHFANIIAAIFIATGQDVAQIVESSLGFTYVEVVNGDLYISVTLPSLEVGTVGGGTRLPTQMEALKILGCQGSGNPPGTNALKFAEIVCATVLAGELSLLAALAAGHLAEAHVKLGRGGVRG